MQRNEQYNQQDTQGTLTPGQLVFQISGYFGIVLEQRDEGGNHPDEAHALLGDEGTPHREEVYIIMLGNGLHEVCKRSEVVALWLPGAIGHSPQQFPELIESYRRAQIVDSRTQCQICSGAGYINYLAPDGYGDADVIPESCPICQGRG